MVSERIYEACRPILEDEDISEEEKTDRLEELLAADPISLTGKALEDAVLGALWQWKSAGETKASPQITRAASYVRSRSPAPWIQRAATPTSAASSPRPSTATPQIPPGFGPQPPAIARTKSSTAGSPFGSPKPSPRLPLATPFIPHSPRLSVYQFSDSSPTTENYGDYGSDTVDWLVNDETSSNTSFGDFGFSSSSDFVSSYTTEMSPYDMLRSILGDNRSDDDLKQVLEANDYDLSQAINALMEAKGMSGESVGTMQQQIPSEPQSRTFLIGKNMSPSSRPVTPAGQQKSSVPCRYWLNQGYCARADCRFAHDTQNHLCKYWMSGNCIAGENCIFSHDLSLLAQQMSLANNGSNQQYAANLQLQDYDSFPALAPTTSNPYEDTDSVDPATLNAVLQQQQQQAFANAAPGLFPTFVPTGPRYGNSRSSSRPGSRNSRAGGGVLQPNFADDEAFPTLGSAASKPLGKRHHGKRGGHGHHNILSATSPQLTPSSLADVVRMSPAAGTSPISATAASSRDAMRRGLKNNRSFTSTSSSAAGTISIPEPKQIPWLETGANVNSVYLKARQEAFKHGGLRNKFLQSAAQAWNRNDARGAKALSLRGQNENALMREKHREAARALYEERNKALLSGNSSNMKELYVDLHGLHPEEAVQYLSDCLKEQVKAGRPVYAICGTGHHSKNGKDKVGKAVRTFLLEWRYVFREFSVPGDRNNVGGILGIDPGSGDGGKRLAVVKGSGDADSGVGIGSDEGRGVGGSGDTKVVLVKEDPRKVVRKVQVEEEDEEEE